MEKMYTLPLLIGLLGIAGVKAGLYDAVLVNYIHNDSGELVQAEVHSINTAAHAAVQIYKINPNGIKQIAQTLRKDNNDNWDYLVLKRYDEKKKIWFEFIRVSPSGNNNDISVIIHPSFGITKGLTKNIIPHHHMH